MQSQGQSANSSRSKRDFSDEEIISKAMRKAIDGGWNAPSLLVGLFGNSAGYEIKGQSIEMVRGMITSHDFAKALWPGDPMGSGVVDPRATSPSTAGPLIPKWKAHLMQMVIADDPIKYLGENI